MFIKVIAVLALAAVCLAEEHAYSSQSIVHHHVHHEHHEPKVEVKVEKQVVKKVVPVAHYVESHKHEEHKHEEHKHEEHKPAISSYHIERHDVPAPPPKDFQKYDGPAKYEFEYQVHDAHTGDIKKHHESRDGYKVEGVYSLHEHDGSIRTVKYHADKKTGFNAEVKHTTKHVEEHKHH